MPSPLVKTTVQGALLGGTSNIIAQILTAYQEDAAISINWTPVFHFAIYSILTAPPNFLWGKYMETLFPSTVPSNSSSKSANPRDGRLSIPNTLFKILQEQTFTALINITTFILFFARMQGSSWAEAASKAHRDLWGLLLASWRVWPLVSAVNMVFVRDLQVRALIGSASGLLWSVYLGLVARGRG